LIWIVHVDPRIQRFLARLADREEVLCGSPEDPIFREAAAPEAIVLAVTDPTVALAFAHRHASRHPGARWVLVREASIGEAELRERFRGLEALHLAFPPDPPALRAALRRATAAEPEETLPERRQREAVASRFARYFQDLPLPDTRQVELAGRGLIIRGEPGTGRLLFARAAHLLAGGERFLHVPCEAATRPEELAARLRRGGDVRELTACLDGLDQVPASLQRELLGWIELGVPEAPYPPEAVHWMVLVSEQGALLPELADGLAALEVHLPPLRDRREAIAGFVAATTEQWCQARGLVRRFSDAALAELEGRPWPGNLRELESTVLRMLASAEGDVVELDASRTLPLAGSAPRETAAPATSAPIDRVVEPAPVSPAAPAEEPGVEEPSVVQLAAALAHELRNPLVSMRTFAELLPERFADPDFRTSFRDHVQDDLCKIDERLARLAHFSELGRGDRKPVNVTELLDRMLEERRGEIQRRRLLVLRELETEQPHAIGHEESLAFLFECLLALALGGDSERADLYIASHHHSLPNGQPALRILFRFHDGRAAAEGDRPDLSPARHSLDLWLAKSALTSTGGNLSIDAGSAGETVALIDLPAA
jgi:signal transduction histidine kinase